MNINRNTRPINWEYIAGFFDGEGCIFYQRRQYSRSMNYVVMHISQSEKNNQAGVMQEIHGFLQANDINARLTYYGQRGNASPAIRVIASSGMSCQNWLLGMLPYLRLKRDKAYEALDFISQYIKHPWLTPLQKTRILELRQDGLGIRKIGKALSIDRQSVKRHLIKLSNYY